MENQKKKAVVPAEVEQNNESDTKDDPNIVRLLLKSSVEGLQKFIDLSYRSHGVSFFTVDPKITWGHLCLQYGILIPNTCLFTSWGGRIQSTVNDTIEAHLGGFETYRPLYVVNLVVQQLSSEVRAHQVGLLQAMVKERRLAPPTEPHCVEQNRRRQCRRCSKGAVLHDVMRGFGFTLERVYNSPAPATAVNNQQRSSSGMSRNAYLILGAQVAVESEGAENTGNSGERTEEAEAMPPEGSSVASRASLSFEAANAVPKESG